MRYVDTHHQIPVTLTGICMRVHRFEDTLSILDLGTHVILVDTLYFRWYNLQAADFRLIVSLKRGMRV
jgi:hypothetical protein